MKNNTLLQGLKSTSIKITLVLTVLFSLNSLSSYSLHIVGGELNYKCLGNNLYEIRLRVYRDCSPGGSNKADYDPVAAIGIFDVNNTLIQTAYLNFPGSTVLPPTLAQSNPCIKVPTNICVEVAEYVGTVTLPPRVGGYQLAYQRCCRNPTIDNLTNPGDQGATYYARIPDQATVACNSNPVFKNWPPIFICANSPIIFDHSATDTDGDSVYYYLCSPYSGATKGVPKPAFPSDPPYADIVFKSPYSASDPMGGVPLTINPSTGLLVGVPNTVGQFVVGVCANEYRNGVLLSTTKRDFQFNVVACQPDVVASFATALSNCTNHTVTFTNNSTGTSNFSWNFGDLTTLADTSNLTNPSYTYPALGTYTVRLIAFHATLPQCNDTTDFLVTVDTCQPCGMTLGITKVDATCGVTGPCVSTPPVKDTQAGATIASNATTITWNHTVTAGGTDRLLIVQLSSVTTAATSVTYGGTPLTLLTQSVNGTFRAEMWYLLAPATGTNSIVVTYPGGSGTFFGEKRGESFSFTSVDQVTPFGTPTSTSGNACPASFTVASGTNELVIDMFVKDYFYPPKVDVASSPAQVEQYSRTINFDPGCGGSLQPGAAPSVTSSWTNNPFCQSGAWAAVGVSMKPACGSSGPTLGSATVTVSGGTSPYTYNWSTTPGQTNPTANNLSAGTYTVTVLDASNCVRTQSVIIDAISTMTVTPSQTDPSTCGSSDGSASVTATGGTAPLTYTWNTTPVQTTPTAVGLSAGTYIVNVVDSAGCSKSVTFTLGQPTVITATASKTDVRCKGGFGTATGNTPTGGTGPYTYSWSTIPVQNTQTATGLKPGYYVVTAVDAGGCSGTAAVTVRDSSLVSTSSSSNVVCFGGATGTATISASLGTPTYTYLWSTSPVQNTQTATGLTAGTYTGIVTDNAGCKDTVTVIIDEPTQIVLEPKNTSTVACAGATNGSAEVLVNGGISPFVYSWCNGQSTSTATGLAAGKCFITVTDIAGCVATDTIDIILPPVLSTTAISSNINCFGKDNGSVTVNPSGGQVPYTYAWSPTVPLQTNQTAINLSAGTYTVLVTDFIGCTATISAVISEPTALSLTPSATNVTCPGANDGTATVSVSGGTPTYSYSWNTSPVQTNPTATGLSGGTYTVTVVDGNGCNTNTSTVVLDINPSPIANFTVANNLTCDGLYVAFSNLSTSASSYLWIFGDGTTSTEKDPSHGFKYGSSQTVLLIAINGICSDTMALNVDVLRFIDYISPLIPNVFTPNGDLQNDLFEIKVGNNLEYCIKISIYDRWGLKMYDNYNGTPWDGRTKSGKAVPDGTYFYILEVSETDRPEDITPYQARGSLSLIR